jgi:hypothetical protein
MTSPKDLIELFRSDLGDTYAYHIGTTILRYVTDNIGMLKHISFGSLKKVVGDAFDDGQVLSTISYLCGDRARVLRTAFEFIDGEDVTPHPVSDSEVMKARKTGIFIHPLTGEPVDQFESKIFIYFEPSEFIQSLKHD